MLWKIKVCPVTSLPQFPVTLGLLVLHTCKCYSHTVLLSPASSVSASQAGWHRYHSIHSIPVIKQYNNACSPWSWTKLRFPDSFWLPGAFPPSWPIPQGLWSLLEYGTKYYFFFLLSYTHPVILDQQMAAVYHNSTIQKWRCLQSSYISQAYYIVLE